MSLGKLGKLGIGLRNPLSECALLKLPNLLNLPKYPPPINLMSEGCRVPHSAKMPRMGSTRRTSHSRHFLLGAAIDPLSHRNLLSEGGRFVLSQKKHPRYSTKTYRPRMLTFWDGAKMTPYHIKLLCAVDIRVITPLSILLCRLEELLCLSREGLLK